MLNFYGHTLIAQQCAFSQSSQDDVKTEEQDHCACYKNLKKVLIVGPAWVGDMVMAQTLFQLLKQLYPDIQIDVLAPAATEPLLALMPEVRRAIILPFKHGEFELLQRYRLGVTLREEQYDWAIVLPNSWKSALIPFFAKIPRRTGWRGEMRYGLLNDHRVLDKEKYPLMIERFMALALSKKATLPEPYPAPLLQVTQTAIDDALQTLQLSQPTQPVLALCPGAQFGPSKRWPAEYYAELANHYLDKGWQVWLFGAGNDVEIATQIEQATEGKALNLVGKTSLQQALALLSLSTQVVTNDSGLMHLAAALGLPLVAIYGSSSPEFTPPLAEDAVILSLNLECSPCFKRECPLKHWRCMLDLKPQRVIDALEAQRK